LHPPTHAPSLQILVRAYPPPPHTPSFAHRTRVLLSWGSSGHLFKGATFCVAILSFRCHRRPPSPPALHPVAGYRGRQGGRCRAQACLVPRDGTRRPNWLGTWAWAWVGAFVCCVCVRAGVARA
jgi:hypothetical protein